MDINAWINNRIARTAHTMDSLIASVHSTFKDGTITIPDDIDLLEQELVSNPQTTELGPFELSRDRTRRREIL